MIKRELYLEKIRLFIDKPVIKMITGMRRCGKSVILKLLQDELAQRGIPPERIIYLNFESLSIVSLQDADSLYRYIMNSARQLPGRLYIMLD